MNIYCAVCFTGLHNESQLKRKAEKRQECSLTAVNQEELHILNEYYPLKISWGFNFESLWCEVLTLKIYDVISKQEYKVFFGGYIHFRKKKIHIRRRYNVYSKRETENLDTKNSLSTTGILNYSESQVDGRSLLPLT